MYGQIHVVIRTLVLTKFGDEIWQKVLTASGVDGLDGFMVFHVYDDSVTISLIGAVSKVLAVPLEVVLELFGEFFLKYCLEHGYDKMLRSLGDNLETFIQNLDSLHSLLAMSYKNFDAPSFRCEIDKQGSLVLHYYSIREGLHPIITGLLRSVGWELFKEEISVKLLELSSERMKDGRMQFHGAFKVYAGQGDAGTGYVSQAAALPRVALDESLQLVDTPTFCSLFPFHIIFGADLQIKQWGNNIARLSNTTLTTGHSMDTVFQLLQPCMTLTYDHIVRFINAVYIMEVLPPDGQSKGGLVLKGQMVLLEDISHVIFIGSPRLADLDELRERNMYLSDIPVYDVTRELVLLNQQRNAEIEVSKELDKTMAELNRTSIALEKEKAKTDMLLYQMLPRKVADALRDGINVEAEKFAEVTILFSDIVTFTNIAAAVAPMQVVDMLNELYHRFDERSTANDVYKVETIGDAYMVVGGVPEPNKTHAEAVANMGLDMVEKAREVKSPATGKPLQIRVGMHSGPVVAGVVGLKMPRYCLFGDTVNTASRMESHGIPGNIHVSPSTYKKLKNTDFILDTRGKMEIKGKGIMTTYLLRGCGSRLLIYDDEEPAEKAAKNGSKEIIAATQSFTCAFL